MNEINIFLKPRFRRQYFDSIRNTKETSSLNIKFALKRPITVRKLLSIYKKYESMAKSFRVTILRFYIPLQSTKTYKWTFYDFYYIDV